MNEVPAAVRSRVASWCTGLVGAEWFNAASFGVIIVNAIVLGLETYDRFLDRAGTALLAVEYACLLCFAVELAIRFGAHLTAPREFFRDGWNLFDLVIVCAPLLPGVRESVTLLRLLRLARVVRAVRLFPSLRVILGGVLRSLPGLGSFLLIATLTIYLYAMVGWMTLGDAYPDRYGTVGQAMLTLFLLLSLDGITDALEAGRVVSEWSILYFTSYIVVASYLLTNLLIGIVLKALEEAHQAEQPGRNAPVPATSPLPPPPPVPSAPTGAGAVSGRAEQPPGSPQDTRLIGERLRELRAALDALEAELDQQRRDETDEGPPAAWAAIERATADRA
ncbi:ion transporter [Micromonospora sp. NPDC050397]|uniref:ion transporter n=1 Tax=Micromonospora sp. NPDC050397 TaxID=3364279 RepID=UPI00385039CB